MTIQLPEPIENYRVISNSEDYSLLHQCFTQSAVVRDEGRQYSGLSAIQGWLEEAKKKYEYSIDPVSLSKDGASVKVVFKATGNFPGSPAYLENSFELLDDRIQSLTIRG
ncbi:nuclear transport factor 2 family protein [Marinobacter nanhaiticus D15-8W]|uniref:Nuclear transport factor 2 family protein n=1 Tax=Marinobacter nanhaiticus D15-8W TaxID=626887 RepID=N6W050_9GAMM|nr:hypothetical protein [Marinobacter nanhaiticus]ENO15905.1 nuclear transport factor 2 family protein [Marinobacter nanhaiticus D15-8W]BES73237.1 nuclear transport factor 2 family protein [Marinobacter nanhaiticus D15-8W]